MKITDSDIKKILKTTLRLDENKIKKEEWDFLIFNTHIISLNGLYHTEDWFSQREERIYILVSGTAEGFFCDDEGHRVWEKRFTKPGETLFENRNNLPVLMYHLNFLERSVIISMNYKAFKKASLDTMAERESEIMCNGIQDELFDVIKSIYLDDGNHSLEHVFHLFSKYARDLDARCIDQFFGDCLYPLEMHYDHWKANLGKLGELLEREKQLLESHSNGLIPDNLPALDHGSYLSYQQRLNIFFATHCFYRSDVDGFKLYGTRMLLDSEENVKNYIDSLNGINREKRSLFGMENPLVFFSSQRPFGSPCMKMIPGYLEEYIGFLHTLDLSNTYATEMGTRLLEEAEMRLERAKEDCEEECLWVD